MCIYIYIYIFVYGVYATHVHMFIGHGLKLLAGFLLVVVRFIVDTYNLLHRFV